MGVPVKALEKAIAEHRGNITRVAQAVKLSRQGVYKRIEASPVLQAAMKEAGETLIDLVEGGLYDAALAGDRTAQIAVLNNHPVSRQRGWGQRLELTGANGGPLRIKAFVGVSPDDWDEDGADGGTGG